MPISFSSFSRRELLRISAASLAGVSWSSFLPRLMAMATDKRPARACILLWMAGGPSQIDTLDPKPSHANGGPTKAIKTSVSGIEIAEHLPGLAAQMRDVAVIRSMKTKEGDHGRATQLMMTGYRPIGGALDYPVLGSVVAHRLQEPTSRLPGFVSVAPFRMGALGPGFLGPKYAPLQVSGTSGDPTTRANLTVENLQPVDANETVLAERLQLLGMLRNSVSPGSVATSKHAAIYESARRMVQTRGEGAFDLDEEPEALRDAYGRSRFGQGCLLARRLVERGVPFVEVVLEGNGQVSWDSHVNNYNAVKAICQVLDPAWATLLTDLRERGMLDSTLVVWMGEFGRTPKINTASGRDHFPDAWSIALAGAKVQGGRVVGSTTADGTQVKERPVSTAELMATVLELLGIDSQSSNMNGDRPIPLVDNEKPISELI